jgi:hypothetical protein
LTGLKMNSAAKGTIGSGPSGDPDAPRAPRGDLSLEAEIRRNIRLSRGYPSTPVFRNGGGRTLVDTIKMAIASQGHGSDSERC